MPYQRTIAHIKGIAYTVAFALATASMVIELAFGSYTQSLSRAVVIFDWIVFPVVMVIGGLFAWAVLTGRIALRDLERPLALFGALFFITKFSIALWSSDVPATIAYAESWYWMLLGTCLLGFLAHDLKGGLVQSIVVYAAALSTHVASVFVKSPPNGFLPLLPDIISSHLRLGATIAVFTVLGYAKEQWLSVEREAITMRHLAHVDPLTKLPNRRQLNQALSKALAQYPGFVTIIVFDVDSFKLINDAHGHPAGDRILREIGQLVQSALRPGHLIGRWGGEEFLVICPNTDLDDGMDIAEQIRCMIEGRQFPKVGSITASFGAARSRVNESAEQLVSRADQALYVSKAKGKNQVHVSE